MNCTEYSTLLEKLPDGSIAPEEEARLREHEASCPACAALRRALDRLPEELDDLKDDVPPMPEGFHQAWVQRVKDERSAARRTPVRAAWTRVLSTAAALVFVVGGTLLSRDALNGDASDSDSNPQIRYGLMTAAPASNGVMLAAGYDTADGADMGVSMKRSAATEELAPADTAREKKIIRNVNMTIGTTNYDADLASLRSLCEENDGWVAYSSEDLQYNGKRQACLSLRIPADHLDDCLGRAQGMGRVTSRYESATDVSDSYYDTRARLDTQLALMERLQALVPEAASLSDLLALESQIADTQYEIDRLQGQLDATDSQVAYATVDVTLVEETPSDAITDSQKTLDERLTGALETGFTAFVDFLQDMLVFLTAALPFLVIVAAVLVTRRMVRRRKKK